MAALPYAVEVRVGGATSALPAYDASTQRALPMAGRDFSTCREDESVTKHFPKWVSKSDTKKDD